MLLYLRYFSYLQTIDTPEILHLRSSGFQCDRNTVPCGQMAEHNCLARILSADLRVNQPAI